MPTECNERSFDFQPLGSREVTARFDGGDHHVGRGGLLLREVEAKTGLLSSLARCFDDFRDPPLIEHSVEEPYQALFAQVFDHLRRWQLPRPEPAPA